MLSDLPWKCIWCKYRLPSCTRWWCGTPDAANNPAHQHWHSQGWTREMQVTSEQRPSLVRVVRYKPSSCQAVKTLPGPRPCISLFRYQCQLDLCQICTLLLLACRHLESLSLSFILGKFYTKGGTVNVSSTVRKLCNHPGSLYVSADRHGRLDARGSSHRKRPLTSAPMVTASS